MPPWLTPQRLHMAWCVSGILGSLLLYGVLQVSAYPYHHFEHEINTFTMASDQNVAVFGQ